MKSQRSEHTHAVKVLKRIDPDTGKYALHSTTHPIEKEHKSSFANLHHNLEIKRHAQSERARDRSDIIKKHKANPIKTKADAAKAELENEPKADSPPVTMTNSSVRKAYTKHMQARIDAHRKENPGLPKGKVQAGFGKALIPGVYRHLKMPKYDSEGNMTHPGWDPPSRAKGLRGRPGFDVWHKACKQCKDKEAEELRMRPKKKG